MNLSKKCTGGLPVGNGYCRDFALGHPTSKFRSRKVWEALALSYIKGQSLFCWASCLETYLKDREN